MYFKNSCSFFFILYFNVFLLSIIINININILRVNSCNYNSTYIFSNIFVTRHLVLNTKYPSIKKEKEKKNSKDRLQNNLFSFLFFGQRTQ